MIDARHPLYSEMTIEAAYDSPDIVDKVFKFYGYTEQAMRLGAKKVVAGASIDTLHKIDIMPLYRDQSKMPNFPVTQGSQFIADYRKVDIESGRRTFRCIEDSFLVLSPPNTFFTGETGPLPQFVLTQAFSGHGDVYYRAVAEILRGSAEPRSGTRRAGTLVGEGAPPEPPQREVLEVQMARREKKRRKSGAEGKDAEFKKLPGGGFSAMLARMAK
jgi:hypothetical protein